MTKDLQKFIKVFDRDTMKQLKDGVEYRGIKNLDNAVSEARSLIDKSNLKLRVIANADMASYGAFEVKESA